MLTVACVVVRTPKMFDKLGRLPVINWSLNKLAEVRGVDRIVCVAEPRLAEKARKAVARQNITLVVMPDAVVRHRNDRSVEKWVCSAGGPAEDADVILFLRPTSPFLPTGKIEKCLRDVREGRCNAAIPGRPTTAIVPGKPRQALKEPVDSLRVFRGKVKIEEADFRVVPVSLIESLDVETDDEYLMATALVASGTV